MVPILLVALGTSLGFAQDVDGFDFSGSLLDASGGIQIPTAHLGEPGAWYAGSGLVMADDPLVIQLGNGTEESLVGRQVSTRLMVGYTTPWNTRVDVQAPYYPRVDVSGARQSGMGDIRLSALVALSTNSSLDLAIQPHLGVPSGDPDLYVTNGFGGGIKAIASGDADPLVWHAQVGADLGASNCLEGSGEDCDGGLALGRDLLGGFGLDFPLSKDLLAGAELLSRIGIAGGGPAFNKNPTDVHGHVTWGDGSGLVAAVIAGTGVVAGVGAPDWRLALAVGWRDPGTPPDADADGIVDTMDQCIDEPEDFDGFKDEDGCPEVDNDKDGVLDGRDGCPDKKEDLDGIDDEDGCPEYDNDGDLVLDVNDLCPNDYGPPMARGCPDRDGDNVPDKLDKCSRTPGSKSNNGCPEASP